MHLLVAVVSLVFIGCSADRTLYGIPDAVPGIDASLAPDLYATSVLGSCEEPSVCEPCEVCEEPEVCEECEICEEPSVCEEPSPANPCSCFDFSTRRRTKAEKECLVDLLEAHGLCGALTKFWCPIPDSLHWKPITARCD